MDELLLAKGQHKSLKKARKLWIATVDVTGNPLYEIYTGNELSIEEFDLDHFVPRSYVSNDELWNLTPMLRVGLFKKKTVIKTYDKENKKPVIKASICNGEQVAGFKDIHTGKSEEVMLIKSQADLDEFKKMYGIDGEIEKEY